MCGTLEVSIVSSDFRVIISIIGKVLSSSSIGIMAVASMRLVKNVTNCSKKTNFEMQSSSYMQTNKISPMQSNLKKLETA
jgi:hypothetical protein